MPAYRPHILSPFVCPAKILVVMVKLILPAGFYRETEGSELIEEACNKPWQRKNSRGGAS